MSKGTPIFQFRLPPLVQALVEMAVERRNRHSKRRAWTASDFVRVAIQEKLEKMIRSRKPRPRPRKEPAILHEEGGVEVVDLAELEQVMEELTRRE